MTRPTPEQMDRLIAIVSAVLLVILIGTDLIETITRAT